MEWNVSLYKPLQIKKKKIPLWNSRLRTQHIVYEDVGSITGPSQWVK